MPGTVVEYNGVRITGCHTKRFQQEAVRDDTGTDLLFHRFTVRIVGYIRGYGDGESQNDTISSVIPASGSSEFGNNAAELYIKVRSKLQEPRKPFTMTTESQVLLRCDAFQGSKSNLANQDLDNGPKPQVIEITNIAANNVLRIEWEVVICMLGCGESDSVENGSGVLSNRWTVLDDIDGNLMTTRTYQGRLRAVSARINPNEFRSYVVPVLQNGFRRERMVFLVSADGLALDYTIVDREVARSAPLPATEWDYSHTVLTGDGMQAVSEVYVRLKSDRTVNHQVLIQLAIQLIDAKLRVLKIGADGGVFVENLQITDLFGSSSNEVQARCRVRHTDGDALNVGKLAIGRLLGKPIDATDIVGYDFNRSYGDGEANIEGPLPLAAAFSCALQTACNRVHNFDSNAVEVTTTESQGGTENRPAIRAYQSGGDLPPEPTPYYSPGHRQSMYSYYQADNQYEMSQRKVQLPIAKASTSLGSSGDDNSDTSAVVLMGRPVARRILRVKGERVGAVPAFPKPEDYQDENGIRHTLLDLVVRPGAPQRTPDGQVLHRADAQYVFALSRQPRPDEQLRVGALPWDLQSQSRTNVNGLLTRPETQVS